MINIEVRITGDITSTASFEVPSERLSDVQSWYQEWKRGSVTPSKFAVDILKRDFIRWYQSSITAQSQEDYIAEKAAALEDKSDALLADITEK